MLRKIKGNYMKTTGYIGTYASDKSKGIYSFSFDEERGIMDNLQLYYPMDDAKYVSLYKGVLAAPCDSSKGAGVCLLDTASNPLQSAALYQEKKTACYVTQDEHYVYSANYHEGRVMIYEKVADQLRFHKQLFIQDKAGCHQVLLSGKYLLVPCLFLDIVRIYDSEQDFAWVRDIPFAKGTGPRHGVFNNDHSRLYLISELSNEVFMFDVKETMELVLRQTIALLRTSKTGASAAIRLTKDDRFLYLSTRETNLISVIDLQGDTMRLVQQISCGGDHPRDLTLSLEERFVLVANRNSHHLVAFPRNEQDGTLLESVSEMKVYEAVSIVLDAQKEVML